MSKNEVNLIDFDSSSPEIIKNNYKTAKFNERSNDPFDIFETTLKNQNDFIKNLEIPETNKNNDNSDDSFTKLFKLKNIYIPNGNIKTKIQNNSDEPLINFETDQYNSHSQNSLLNDLHFTNITKCLPDDEDNIMSVIPELIDSETDENNTTMEMLKLPIVGDLNLESSFSITMDEDNVEKTIVKENIRKDAVNKFENIKHKAKHDNDNKKINELITELKTLILNCSNDDVKKITANCMLESLEKLLKNESDRKIDDDNTNLVNDVTEQKELNTFSKLFIRQDTFDVKDKSPESTQNNLSDNNDNKNVSTNIVIMDNPSSDVFKRIDQIFKEQNIENKLENDSKRSTFVFVVSSTPKKLIRQASEICGKYNCKTNKNDNNGEHDDDKTQRRRSSSFSGSIKNKNITTTKTLTNNTRSLNPPKQSSTIKSSNNRKSINVMSNIRNHESEKKLLEVENNAIKGKVLKRRSFNVENLNELKNNTSTKLRVKSNELNKKSSGPMKATLPIPTIKVISPPSDNNLPQINTPINPNTNKPSQVSPRTTVISRRSVSSIQSTSTRQNAIETHSRYSQYLTPNSRPKTNRTSLIGRRSFGDTANRLNPTKMGTQTLKQGKPQNNKENNSPPKRNT